MADGMDEAVNHPAHYTFSAIEVIDAIEAWQLGYHLGNVVKYVARAEHKGSRLQDLRKARWYLDREIERAERDSVPVGEPDIRPYVASVGAGEGMPCCPKCAQPNRTEEGFSMLRCEGCGHLWEREPAEVAR